MVRRLIEEKNGRFAKKKLGECYSHLPAARVGSRVAIAIRERETEALQDSQCTGFEIVTTKAMKFRLKITVSAQQSFMGVISNSTRLQFSLYVLDLDLTSANFNAGSRRFAEQRTSAAASLRTRCSGPPPTSQPSRALAMDSAVMAGLAIMGLVGLTSVVRRFGHFIPRPLGENVEKAGDVLDDLPSILSAEVMLEARLPQLDGPVN